MSLKLSMLGRYNEKTRHIPPSGRSQLGFEQHVYLLRLKLNSQSVWQAADGTSGAQVVNEEQA